MIRLIFICTLSIFIYSCSNNAASETIVPRDTTITKEEAFNTEYLDSTAMEDFFQARHLTDTLATSIRNFYNQRNYQLAWFDSTGLSEHALSFLEMRNQYMEFSSDSSIFNQELRNILDSVEAGSRLAQMDAALRIQTELQLTRGFFDYASAAYEGNSNLQLQDLGWYIPRKKLNITQLLDSLVKNNGAKYGKITAVNKQYDLLQKQLAFYSQLEKQGNWDSIILKGKPLKFGDSADIVITIKDRLYRLGDMTQQDTTNLIDSNMVVAIKRFQTRHGLSADAVMGNSFFKQLNVTPGARLRQLLINLERLRWVPAETPADYLLVNIPAFQLFIYKDDSLSWSMNVVVGSSAHNTVVFRGDMKYIVFSPYWNVPNSIVRNEIEPALKRNPNYLEKNNMERYSGGIRQKPGPNNSLGLVKFLFPNQYNIYLHDTPTKSLFSRDQRAFSHGCIRLSQPKRLAEYLLANDKSWTTEKMEKAMKGGKEVWVTLNPTIPVFIGYFTAWQGSDGLLHFRDDVYGHDKKLAAKLF